MNFPDSDDVKSGVQYGPQEFTGTLEVPKTVAKLYETNSDVRRLIDFWVQERRCPMGLVDELLSEGMEDAADCALWAATEPERGSGIGQKLLPPYPGQYVHNHHWFRTKQLVHPRDVPFKNTPDHCRKEHIKGTTNAIIWLLDNWRRK